MTSKCIAAFICSLVQGILVFGISFVFFFQKGEDICRLNELNFNHQPSPNWAILENGVQVPKYAKTVGCSQRKEYLLVFPRFLLKNRSSSQSKLSCKSKMALGFCFFTFLVPDFKRTYRYFRVFLVCVTKKFLTNQREHEVKSQKIISRTKIFQRSAAPEVSFLRKSCQKNKINCLSRE